MLLRSARMSHWNGQLIFQWLNEPCYHRLVDLKLHGESTIATYRIIRRTAQIRPILNIRTILELNHL